MIPLTLLRRLIMLVLLLGGLTACSTPTVSFRGLAQESGVAPAPIVSSLLSDTHTRRVPVGQKVTITTAHTDPDGVREVVFFVDGNPVQTHRPPYPQTYFQVQNEFTPSSARTYAVRIVAYSQANKPPSVLELSITAAEGILPVATQPPAAAALATPTLPSGGKIACANEAELVEETLPDGTEVQPGTAFVKTWRIKNTGTCDWGAGYTFDLVSGPAMGATRLDVPHVPRGSVHDFTLSMVAPTEKGTYRSDWRLFAPDGNGFGNLFFVEIVVPESLCREPVIRSFTANPSTIPPGGSSTLIWEVEGADTITLRPEPQAEVSAAATTVLVRPNATTTYTLTATRGNCTASAQVTVTVGGDVTLLDFIAAAPTAVWQTDARTLSWPGSPTDPAGYARWLDGAVLQNGTVAPRVLDVRPLGDALIQGRYTASVANGVQPTDVVRLKLAYLQGAVASSGASYRLQFVPDSGSPVTIGPVTLDPNGAATEIALPLSGVQAGQQGTFILQVDRGANPDKDTAVWVEARLVRPAADP